MQNLIATTFEVVHYIALQAVHYKPLQEVHLSRYNQETVQANYRRIKEEVKQIVQEELERIKNDPVLCKLLPDNETV